MYSIWLNGQDKAPPCCRVVSYTAPIGAQGCTKRRAAPRIRILHRPTVQYQEIKSILSSVFGERVSYGTAACVTLDTSL